MVQQKDPHLSLTKFQGSFEGCEGQKERKDQEIYKFFHSEDFPLAMRYQDNKTVILTLTTAQQVKDTG